MKLQVVTTPIDKSKISPLDSLGLLFKSNDNVYNIPNNLEDVLKSAQLFGNTPQQFLLVSNEEIKEGDVFLSIFDKIDIYSIGYFPPKIGSKKIVASYPHIQGTSEISREQIQQWIDAGCPTEIEATQTISIDLKF